VLPNVNGLLDEAPCNCTDGPAKGEACAPAGEAAGCCALNVTSGADWPSDPGNSDGAPNIGGAAFVAAGVKCKPACDAGGAEGPAPCAGALCVSGGSAPKRGAGAAPGAVAEAPGAPVASADNDAEASGADFLLTSVAELMVALCCATSPDPPAASRAGAPMRGVCAPGCDRPLTPSRSAPPSPCEGSPSAGAAAGISWRVGRCCADGAAWQCCKH
jgi:hypothetical protein